MEGDTPHELLELVCASLDREPPATCAPLVAEVKRRLGDALASVVFYGSCLRRGSDEGVLDFYAIVDDYAQVHPSRLQCWANALLPPSVFYIEVDPSSETDAQTEVLRAKVAVISSRDLLRATSARVLRTGIWARFCQPAQIVYTRDCRARQHLHRVAAESVLTALWSALPLLPEAAGRKDEVEFSARELWQALFAATYANELRPESRASVGDLFAANPAHYERALQLGLARLQTRDSLVSSWQETQPKIRVALRRGAMRRGRARWRRRRPLARAVYALQLIKTAFTFGDAAVPYALFKVERHTGTRFNPSERQRRHPLLFGWPLIFQILRQRSLRSASTAERPCTTKR